MNTSLVLFLIFISMTSLIVSFIATIQILTNDFKESKTKWIIISLIGIIGPVLYIKYGRKYLVKKTSLNKDFTYKDSFSLKNYYAELISNLQQFLILIFSLSILLITYGYLVRLFSISFFWESKQLGFILFFICLAFFLRADSIKRKSLKIKNIVQQILFCFLFLIILFNFLSIVIFPQTEAYKEVVKFINSNKDFKKELGEINGYTVLPRGSFHKKSDKNGVEGNAKFNLIIKGEIKYKEVEFIVKKNPEDIKWEVVSFE